MRRLASWLPEWASPWAAAGFVGVLVVLYALPLVASLDNAT